LEVDYKLKTQKKLKGVVSEKSKLQMSERISPPENLMYHLRRKTPSISDEKNSKTAILY
jgi:hypothetical protein